MWRISRIGPAALWTALSLVALLCVACTATPVPPTPAAQAPTAAGAVHEPSPSLTPTPTAAPPPTPTATPTPTPWAGPLPAGTIALYSAGAEDESALYALTADGRSIDLHRTVTGVGLTSPSGRWLACSDDRARPQAVIITDLESGRRRTVPLTIGRGTGDVVWGAFDRAEAHLAFVEIGALYPTPQPGTPTWFIVIVDLQDGSAQRCVAGTASDRSHVPLGRPLGWSAAGELVLDGYRLRSEGGSTGLWALGLPPDATPAPGGALASRPLVLMPWSLGGKASPEGQHLVDRYQAPQLSPDGTRLIFLARDLAYKPADYKPEWADTALNQLWTLDLATGKPARLVEVTDGGALAALADWSSDGREIIYGQGSYTPTFAPGEEPMLSAMLKVRDAAGAVRDIGWLPGYGYLRSFDWCAPGWAVATSRLSGPTPRHELYTIDLATGRAARAAEAPFITFLGAVR